MKRFKTFVAEAATKKVFIDHLDKMKPLKFLELAQKLNTQYKGFLSKETISITEKIDGSALRIGQDENGKPFIESSMSPSTFNVGDFTSRALAKGYTSDISKHFDNLLNSFKTHNKVQNVLSKYNLNGIKVIGEILYPPMGISEIDKIKFVRISYDKSKLGTQWTFVPFEVLDGDGNEHPRKKEVLNDLVKISTNEYKIFEPKIEISDNIDITLELKDFDKNVVKKYKNLETVLTSRKKIDKELKEKIKDEFLSYQKQIALKIMSYFKSGSLGPDFEGIVIKLSDGDVIKIVTDKFKTGKFEKKS